MVEKIDLKKIERKVYTSYHQDGLIDISIAFIVLAFGIMMVLDMAWMGGIFAVIGISLYAAAKKTLTVPRIGCVKFARYRVKAMQTIALGVLSLFMLLGVVAVMQFEGVGTPIWLLFVIENFMLVIGASGAIFFSVVAYGFKIYRMYAYSILTLILFASGHFVNYPFPYYVLSLGAVILISGAVTLFRFTRRYPLPVKKTAGDIGNEGQRS